MGSATRSALRSARQALATRGGRDGLATGEQLFQAARVIGASAQLRSALADPAVAVDGKTAVINSVFHELESGTRDVLCSIVSSRWSTQDDLLAGIEEIGIRSVAASVPQDTALEQELFAFGVAVAANAELELAVGSKLASAQSKAALVASLLKGKASAETLAIVGHLVQLPRGRRIGELLRYAASIVADQAHLLVATVTAAAPLSSAQRERLRAALATRAGRDLQFNLMIDPTLIGGLRVQVGDDVTDGSVATRITDLRVQLAS